MKRASVLGIAVVLAFLFVLAPIATRAQTVPRVILLEHFTGTWAEWSPRGEDSLAALQSRWPNTRSISYHLSSTSSTDPMETAAGNVVRDSLGAGFIPSLVIDRIVWQISSTVYSFILDWTLWEQATAIRTANSPNTPLSISVTGVYDSIGRQVTGMATITALQAMPGTYNVHVVISENGLVYPQLQNTGTSVITVPNYIHNRVVRQMATGGIGTQLTTTGFAANQVVMFPINFALSSGIDWTKATMTVFVDADLGIPYGHRYVQQTWQAPLTALTIIPVELVSLTGDAFTDAIRIAWRTATENNNMGWHVERRNLSDMLWEDVGFVAGHGTTRDGKGYAFIDRGVAPGITYDYRLRQVDYDGRSDFSAVVRVTSSSAPSATELSESYPNPFRGSTGLTVDLAEEGPAMLQIVDAVGRTVATLASGTRARGRHTYTWNGRDDLGHPMPPGMYFARLTTASTTQTRQVMMLR